VNENKSLNIIGEIEKTGLQGVPKSSQSPVLS